MNRTSTFLTVTMVIMLTLVSAEAGRKPQQLVEPDYTKGEVLIDKWNLNISALGSTGAIGNVWDGAGGPRMIQVCSVENGSPADGILQKGDVILGIGSGKFSSDARKAISIAITQAETKASAGKLTLNVYRPEGDPKLGKGEVLQLTLMLPVLGSFSESAPWECDKTRRLIDMAAESIVKNGFFKVPQTKGKKGKGKDAQPPEPNRVHGTWLAALGLLATGEEKYLPVVRDYVRAIGKPDIDPDWKSPHKVSWGWSYTNLLLCEYYLATKDDYVLPAITKFSTEIAKGASNVGTFGHRMSYYYTVDGVEQKYPPGYGAMNQCSITCALSLVLAQKCGVKDPEVAKVIEKSRTFYRWYVDKGTIPYGDHGPVLVHDNNGVNSQVAVMFDLLGDKEAARYFTRMTLASYRIREQGHTGHFFSWQWGALGAARGGPKAAQSFISNTRWFTELERRSDGRYVYQPQLASKDHGKYRYWSTTGSRLLQHCLPRKKLYITGKGGSCFGPIIGNELEECVAAGQFDPKSCSVEQLLGFLGSWSPIVRAQAAGELGTREEDVSKKLIAMLDSPDSRVQCGACSALQLAGRGSMEAVDKMVKLLQTSDDMTLRFTICQALARPRPGKKGSNELFKAGLGDAVLKAGPALLKLAATYEPDTDPLRKLHFMLSSTLFYSGRVGNTIGYYPKGQGLQNIDSDLKVAVIKSLLRNPNGCARSQVSGLYSSLSPQELEQLWGDIYAASKYQAPSGSMFAGGVRGNGIAFMAKHHVKEGIEVGFHWTFVQEGWGDGSRKWRGVPALKLYGLAAADYFPLFEKQIEDCHKPNSKGRTDPNKLAQAKAWQKQLDEMKTMTAPKLISIQSHIKKVNPKEFYSVELKK